MAMDESRNERGIFMVVFYGRLARLVIWLIFSLMQIIHADKS